MTVQRDDPSASPGAFPVAPWARRPAADLDAPLIPPAPGVPQAPERAQRIMPTMPPRPRFGELRALFDLSFETALPPVLARLLYVVAAAVAALVLLAAVVAGTARFVSSQAEVTDTRTAALSLLAWLAWVIAGAVLAGAILVLGRAAAGIVLLASKMEARRGQGPGEGG